MSQVVPLRGCADCNKAEGVYQQVTSDGKIRLLCRSCRNRALRGRPALHQATALIENARRTFVQKEQRTQKNRHKRIRRGLLEAGAPGFEGDR